MAALAVALPGTAHGQVPYPLDCEDLGSSKVTTPGPFKALPQEVVEVPSKIDGRPQQIGFIRPDAPGGLPGARHRPRVVVPRPRPQGRRHRVVRALPHGELRPARLRGRARADPRRRRHGRLPQPVRGDRALRPRRRAELARDPAVEQREDRDVRHLVLGLDAVGRRRHRQPAPEDDRPGLRRQRPVRPRPSPPGRSTRASGCSSRATTTTTGRS